MKQLSTILHKITALCDVPEPYILKQLIDALRVAPVKNNRKRQFIDANDNILTLINLLRQNPTYATGLATFLLTLLNKYHCMSLYTDTGILSDQGFFNSLIRLTSHRFIPLLPEDNSIIELVDYLFDVHDDERWLASIDDDVWVELIGIITVDDTHEELVATAKNNVLNAMVVLSYRIGGIGLHPDLMRAYPKMLDYSAAFAAQNQETVLFANQYRTAHQLDCLKDVIPSKEVDSGPLLVMLEQCDDILNTLRKRIYKTGISIRLTNMMLRLEQSITRMQILSELLSDKHENRDKAVFELIQAIVISTKNRYSIRHLIDKNTKLLSQKVTENASRVGEHYISTDKSGYKSMFKKAAIGGFIIAFMATIKILSYDLDLAPMGRAFVNSMIYGLGFVFIHIIHGTVATKQPAMTAAAIASTISNTSGKKSHQLAKLSELMVDILRTQFVAIMGNVLLAMPLALLISVIWLQVSGEPMIAVDKAEHLLHDLNPFHSLALFHAAIAGVFLFMSGLIAGYYDNLAIFNNIGQRIARHNLLLNILPKRWPERLGKFIENNLGAIMGNFLFGVFLGSTATVGYIFGLPLDIRHIAFASANFAHGLFNMPVESFSLSIVFISLLGVALIGVINLMVSFSLAMIIALRAKGVRVFEWKNLTKMVLTHFITHPKDFFWPRPEPMQYSQIDSHGHMIYKEIEPTGHSNTAITTPAVRRLSDISVMPKGVGIDYRRIEDMQHKKDFENQLNGSAGDDNNTIEDNTSIGNRPDSTAISSQVAKTVVLDDGLEDTLVQDGFDSNKALAGDDSACTPKNTLDITSNAKNPLPKPKKPPKLPE